MIKEIEDIDYPIVFQYLKEYFYVNYTKINTFEKFLIYKDKQILGFLSYSIIYERAELNYILVLPNYRNQNIATILLEKMLQELKNNNINDITLEVELNNIPAINLYKKYGFKKVGIREKYYGSTDGILMKKEIGD